MLDRQGKDCAPDTLRWYGQKLKRWQRSINDRGVQDIEQITVAHLRAFLVELQGTVANGENPFKPDNPEGKRLSDLTVHGYAEVIKAFCHWLYLDELLDKDPSARLAMPKVGSYVVKSFTVQHLDAMLEACDTRTALGFRDFAMVALMADTGLRLGELIRLTVDNFIQVNRQGKSHIRVIGKGKREREIGVSPQVAKLLWKYLRLHRQARTPDEQLLFLGRYGKSLTQRGVEDIVQRLRDKAGIDDVRCSPHTFRHTFAVEYMERGGDIFKLSRELGHGKVSTTEQYIKTLPLSTSRQDHEKFSVIRSLKMDPRRRNRAKDAS